MRYRVDNGILKKLSNVIVNPSSEEINNFDNGVIWYEDNNGFLYNYLKINNKNILLNKVLLPYLKFSSDDNFTLSVATPGWIANGDGIIEYSLDKGNTWTTWNGSQLSGDEDNPIYLRGIGNTVITGSNLQYRWTFTGKYIIGNIENLLDYQTVANRQHPTMGGYCYTYMFNHCTSLITPPELPATTLTGYCYSGMFHSCSSLIVAPELPATVLIVGCYESMFQDCISLTTPPKLPATTLDSYCYSDMFSGCTSLTTPPELPATILANFCYTAMFYKCTSLITAPHLPATTLAQNCYQRMFRNCSSLITLPELPATTLIDYCYNSMFGFCTSLKLSATQDSNIYKYSYRIPTSSTGVIANNALNEMFIETGGTFKGTPTINTTYYTDHQPV